MSAHFGESKHTYTRNVQSLGGSEDFSILGTAVGKPCVFFLYGGTDKELWDKCEEEGTLSEKIPINHSGLFYPVIQPTLTVAVDSSRELAIRLVRTVEVRRGIGSSELEECASSGRKCLYGSPFLKSAFDREGTPVSTQSAAV